METEYGETTFYQIINDEKCIDTDKGSSQSGYRAGDGPCQPDKDFPALAGSASGRIETEQEMASHPSLAKTRLVLLTPPRHRREHRIAVLGKTKAT